MKVTHAGAVAFRDQADGSERLFLIVTSAGRGEWVLPKGHIEAGESTEAAALRELREEAGVNGEILAPIGLVDYRRGDVAVHVMFYLVRAEGVQTAAEDRSILWLPYGQARALLTFDEAKGILDLAAGAKP